MMTRGVLMVAAVCGSAGASVERGFGFSAELTFDRDQIAIGESAVATLTLFAPSNFTGYFSAFNGELLASESIVEVADVAPVAWNNPWLGFAGEPFASGADVLGIDASQFSLIPPVVFSNPLLVTTFTVTGTGLGELTYEASISPGRQFLFWWSWAFDPYTFDETFFFSETLTVVPAPSGLACVLGCALVAARRRR
jgi:hypothetical protein